MHRGSIITVIIVAVAAITGASGCALFGGGGGPAPKAKGYRLSVPQTWKERDKADSDRAYQLASGNIVAVNSSCEKNTRAPLEILTKHLLFGSRNVEVQERERVQIADSEALLSRVKANVDDTPFHLELLVFAKGGCVFDFSLMSPKPIPTKDSEEFQAFVRSFRPESE